MTRVQGDVRVKVTTNGESVVGAEAESGHPLLRTAAEDNVKTWKFAAHTPGIFYVTYRYKVSDGGVDVEFLSPPDVVKITAQSQPMSIYYADLGLGTWKARLTSAHGKSLQTISLSYTGQDGDSLDGRIVTPTGDGEEIDFGHRDGDFLAFSIIFEQPDGKRVKTFLVGKMMGNKIVGTFVDAGGIRGDWSAIRTTDRPNS
jgi:hypothetical protein